MEIDENNLIPIMTSNTSPSGIASASNVYSDGNYNAFKAFDHINSSIYCWYTNNISTGWLQYKFMKPQRIVKYIVTSRNISSNTSLPLGAPKSWTFEGSNDGINFDILDTQQSITGWISDETKEFTFNNIKTYLYYRINISASNSSNVLGIGELQMIGQLNKYLIKQNNNYYTIQSDGSIQSLGIPTDNTQLEQWFNNYGVNDLNELCAKYNTETIVSSGEVLGEGKLFTFNIPNTMKNINNID